MNPLKKMLHAIVARPAVYDAVQRLAGLNVIRARLEPHLREAAGRIVLDVGAGTGLYLPCFPERTTYIWLDTDLEKLRGFWARYPEKRAVVIGDGACLGLKDKSVDYATCAHLIHHLNDAELSRLVQELSRVVRRKLILQEPITSSTLASRILWAADRGSHPRTREALLKAFGERFDLQHAEYYSVFHRYMLWVGVPR